MYKLTNGWTKETMKEAIIKGNNGTKSADLSETGSICRYRRADGNKCAVGCFIQDKDYKPHFELATLPELSAMLGYLPLHPEGLRELQIVHDRTLDSRDPRPLLCAWIDSNVE